MCMYSILPSERATFDAQRKLCFNTWPETHGTIVWRTAHEGEHNPTADTITLHTVATCKNFARVVGKDNGGTEITREKVVLASCALCTVHAAATPRY